MAQEPTDKTDNGGPPMLTVQDIADRTGLAPSGIRKRLKEGKIPGAILEQTPMWPRWLVPESALVLFVRRPVGRPPKPKPLVKDEPGETEVVGAG